MCLPSILRCHAPTLLLALLAGIAVSGPQWVHMLDARYEGIPVRMNDDETSYQTQLQEALLGRFGQAGKGITAASVNDPNFHLSPVEEIEGLLFRWTGWRAVKVFVLLNFVIPFLLALVLVPLARALGFSKREALLATALFFALQLSNLTRPIHPRESFLLTALALLALVRARGGSRWWGALFGACTGVLLGAYVWGWMIAACAWGVTILIALAERRWREARSFGWAGAAGAAFSLPFALHMLSIRSHPAYADAVERTGLIHWRLPESVPWSVLFAVMAMATLALWIRRGRPKDEASFVALALTAFAVFNQQLVHGYVLMFRAHVVLFLTLVAALTLIHFVRRVRQSRSVIAGAGALASLVIIGALAFDGRKLLGQWSVVDGDFAHQHLASALPALDALPRSVILSDPSYSEFISGSTKHDVVFTNYLQHTLVTHEELAEAFCLTQLPVPEERRLEDRAILVLGNAVWSQLDPERRAALREKDLALATEACARLDADPAAALRRAGVQYVFWNEKEVPGWELSRLKVPLEKVAGGDQWSLWRVAER